MHFHTNACLLCKKDHYDVVWRIGIPPEAYRLDYCWLRLRRWGWNPGWLTRNARFGDTWLQCHHRHDRYVLCAICLSLLIKYVSKILQPSINRVVGHLKSTRVHYSTVYPIDEMSCTPRSTPTAPQVSPQCRTLSWRSRSVIAWEPRFLWCRGFISWSTYTAVWKSTSSIPVVAFP